MTTEDPSWWARHYGKHEIEVFRCKPGSKVPAGGRGHLDATTDDEQIQRWWPAGADWNIGGRPPADIVVLDIDTVEGHGVDGMANLLDLAAGRPIPWHSVTAMSPTGSLHLWVEHPGPYRGRLCDGVDIKGHGGYVVLPPSVHPNGGRYAWISSPEAYIEQPAEWLADAIRPQQRIPVARPLSRPRALLPPLLRGSSIADEFTANTTWAEILGPHGWRLARGTGDDDGSVWLHPAATSACSATVRNGCLFVYSTNTPFEVTEHGDTHGYTRFRAHAVLDHAGDLAAAARAARTGRAGAA
ncbi:bifunctional DNA primase/polymerase [Tsukamurella asaccharolytica]|uniref:Bifunctional DNA primase/polymerase n=1 Tax=Tsukamurella asaccharolytica TaxID=2592067 RepID=A0A5C5RCS2_9ACTN|nr:bifunctional DNA primase/polymerase [Tsukamurella asaccharolytica]TWS20636.1 bifunctional DNA primase/polymerase [Tsukamurella asaccharolytica]